MKNKKKILVIFIAVAVLLTAILIITSSMGAPLDKDSDITVAVTIPQGSGSSYIGQLLEDEEIVKNGRTFRILSKVYGFDGRYKAGTYAVRASMSMREIMELLCSADTVSQEFTITDGQTIAQISDNLEACGICSKDEFLEAVQKGEYDYYFLPKDTDSEYRLEGYIYPDTYQFEIGTSAEDIIRQILDTFKVNVADVYYDTAVSKKMDFHDVIITASIIEREAAVADDRPLVSSVIYNRLDKGMLLQMCSTVQYILGEQKPVLSNADIAIESPYNTYIHEGLPPGPISNPGADSVKAAIYPADTDYIYFVVSEKLDGSQNFSSDYNQFLKDKEAYYKAYEESLNE